jgi:hypothetical protein
MNTHNKTYNTPEEMFYRMGVWKGKVMSLAGKFGTDVYN